LAAAATPGSPTGADATPSMGQYLEIKAANPDSLLWYRMGDFYELFFDDAVIASQALSIVLTKRGKHQGQDIPMCGVPVVRAAEYLQRLIRQGYRVAVCEQLEDPAEARKRGAKAVVRRDVVRLVTPGTLTEDALLDARARNYLAAVFIRPTAAAAGTIAETVEAAIAAIDISTGECESSHLQLRDLAGELLRLSPGEILASDDVLANPDIGRWIALAGAATTPVPAAYFDSESGARVLKDRLGVADLDGIGAFTRPELAAFAAVLRYIDLTQLGRAPLLRPPRRQASGVSLTIDAATRASLELVKTTSEDKSATLLASIDRTVTGAGARAMHARLSNPLSDPAAINRRLDVISYLIDDRRLTEALRDALRSTPDLARALPRLAFARGGPRDLASVRDALAAADRCFDLLEKAATPLGLPEQLDAIRVTLAQTGTDLASKLAAALVDDAPQLKRDGGFIRSGYSADLDQARTLRDDGRGVLAELEARYANETGIKTLKVRHNNILGYFIEVTQLAAKPLLSPPLSDTFRHRQTMANAVRFSTAELLETEGRVATASERALSLELEIFAALSTEILAADQRLGAIAEALAELDVMAALTVAALEQKLVRPVVDDSLTFDIRGGRHPVVAQALAKSKAGSFIANDCLLSQPSPAVTETPDSGLPDAARLWLVTGPNMAGKSTYLRQNALIVVLAQMGSFVPAASAHIGVVDRLFSRVGAADDLARGRSTFMVEMVETAAILNAATDRSLVILDEIGRGTATFDGLSIAWATVEYLHEMTRCRALFATHYHELTALSERLSSMANVTMDVSEWQDDIVFLHRVRAGSADRSYGIQVARLAGLPAAVIHRASEVLEHLEAADQQPSERLDALDDLPLFAAQRPKGGGMARSRPDGEPSALEAAVMSLRPDELAPKAALEKLYELKSLAESLKKADR
jgi:DNA mismatch repair protein MutS